MKERIAVLRKKLGLNQAEFGEKIGLTYSAISAIEIGKNPLTDANIKLISLTYGISEEWIRHGVGDMFNPANNDPYILEVVTYMQKMDEPERQVVLNYVRWYVSQQQSLRGEPPETAQEAPETRETPGIGPRLEDGQAG